MKKLISFSLFLLLAAVLLSAKPAWSLGFTIGGEGSQTQSGAQKAVDAQLKAAAGTKGANYAPATDPRYTVAFIIRIVLTTLGIVFLVVILYAGFTLMTAGGNEEKIEKSRKLLIRSVIGLMIIFAAYSITILAFRIAVNYFQDKSGYGQYYTPLLPQ